MESDRSGVCDAGAMDSIQSIHVIAANPQVRDGRPRIAGTTVTVADLAIARIYQDQDADRIADWYGLTLAGQAALSYYL